jgi:hypothetical protein
MRLMTDRALERPSRASLCHRTIRIHPSWCRGMRRMAKFPQRSFVCSNRSNQHVSADESSSQTSVVLHSTYGIAVNPPKSRVAFTNPKNRASRSPPNLKGLGYPAVRFSCPVRPSAIFQVPVPPAVILCAHVDSRLTSSSSSSRPHIKTPPKKAPR